MKRKPIKKYKILKRRNPLTEEDEDKLEDAKHLIYTYIRLNEEAKYPNEIQLNTLKVLEKRFKSSEDLDELNDELQEIISLLERIRFIIA